MESFLKGKSRYEATGRLLGLSRKSLIEFYQSFGRSHYEIAVDYIFYTICYYIVSESRHGGCILKPPLSQKKKKNQKKKPKKKPKKKKHPLGSFIFLVRCLDIPLIAPMITILVFMTAPAIFQSALSLRAVLAEVDAFGKWAFQSQTKDVMLKEWHRRALSEAIGRKLTGNAAYKLGFSRLQTYSTTELARPKKKTKKKQQKKQQKKNKNNSS